jgi:cytochrome c2
MPDFHFQDDEIEAVTTFLLGLTDEEIDAKMKRNLKDNEVIIEKGKKVVINKNCVSCHLFTKDTIILYNPLKNEYSRLEGVIRQYNKEKKLLSFSNLTPNSSYPFNIIKTPKNFDEVKEVFFGLGAFAKEDILSEEAKFRGLSELRKYELQSFYPPPLYYEGEKTQKGWLVKFLTEPFTLRPWLYITMPKFTFTQDELNHIIGFFNNYSNITIPYEYYPRLEANYIESKLKVDPDYLKKAKAIFDKLECTKCHIVGSKTPAGSPEEWAPDLLLAKHRLNPEWIVKWLQDPQKIQPQTKMPNFFSEGSPSKEVIKDYFEGDTQKQIEAIVDYLLHSLKEEKKE